MVRNSYRHRHIRWIKLLAAVVGFYLMMCLCANVSGDYVPEGSNYNLVETFEEDGQ